MSFPFTVISAAPRITEPPNCSSPDIDPAFRDRAPHMVTQAADLGADRRRPTRSGNAGDFRAIDVSALPVHTTA